MKALSLWQIYATLIDIDAKRYETRSWSTDYRGPLVIHAAKSLEGIRDFKIEFDQIYMWGKRLDSYPLVKYALPAIRSSGRFPSPFKLEMLPLGCALCVVDLVDCIPTEKIRNSLTEQERAFGNYNDDRFAWKLANVRSFREPSPMKGAQGLFNCTISTRYLVYR